MMDNNWFCEKFMHGGHIQGFKVKSILHSEQTQFQKIEILDTEVVGKLMLLDGKTMVSNKDEFVYHEVMSHIPYMVSRKCQKVLIIGGGDGGIVREFVKHPDIEQIDLVEIDERVIEVSKQFFPECTSGLSDKRVNILPMDGFEFIKKKKNYYDVICVDSTDPVDFASGLFTKEFYKNIYDALTDDGIMMNQTENPFLDQFGIKDIYQNMRAHFPVVASFMAPMLIYPGVSWTFGFSSKKYRPTDLNPSKRLNMNQLEKSLQWYNMDWHQGAFKLSNYHKKMIGA